MRLYGICSSFCEANISKKGKRTMNNGPDGTPKPSAEKLSKKVFWNDSRSTHSQLSSTNRVSESVEIGTGCVVQNLSNGLCRFQHISVLLIDLCLIDLQGGNKQKRTVLVSTPIGIDYVQSSRTVNMIINANHASCTIFLSFYLLKLRGATESCVYGTIPRCVCIIDEDSPEEQNHRSKCCGPSAASDSVPVRNESASE